MTFKGKVSNIFQVFPYGLFSNLSNDSLGVTFALDGSENNRAAISGTFHSRPSDLEQGEVCLYHPYTNSFIKFRNSGDIEIDSLGGDSPGNITVNCHRASVNCEENLEVSCVEANISASSSVNIDSPQVNLGDGGPSIARVGDTVQVEITSGSSSGVYSGQITSGGDNTSI